MTLYSEGPIRIGELLTLLTSSVDYVNRSMSDFGSQAKERALHLLVFYMHVRLFLNIELY